MVCPKCGSKKLEVIDTRPTSMNGIRRLRKCIDCGERITSYELTIDEIINNNNQIRDEIKQSVLKNISSSFVRPITIIEKYRRKEKEKQYV